MCGECEEWGMEGVIAAWLACWCWLVAGQLSFTKFTFTAPNLFEIFSTGVFSGVCDFLGFFSSTGCFFSPLLFLPEEATADGGIG